MLHDEVLGELPQVAHPGSHTLSALALGVPVGSVPGLTCLNYRRLVRLSVTCLASLSSFTPTTGNADLG